MRSACITWCIDWICPPQLLATAFGHRHLEPEIQSVAQFRLDLCDNRENAHEGRNIFCIYRLVQTSEWAEECGKIWVLYIPEYVRNKWNLVYYSNLQYIVCTNILLSPGRAWNFHQSKLSSQTSWTSNCLTQVWNVIWFVKKKSGGTKSQQWASHKPPEWGIKM